MIFIYSCTWQSWISCSMVKSLQWAMYISNMLRKALLIHLLHRLCWIQRNIVLGRSIKSAQWTHRISKDPSAVFPCILLSILFWKDRKHWREKTWAQNKNTGAESIALILMFLEFKMFPVVNWKPTIVNLQC